MLWSRDNTVANGSALRRQQCSVWGRMGSVKDVFWAVSVSVSRPLRGRLLCFAVIRRWADVQLILETGPLGDPNCSGLAHKCVQRAGQQPAASPGRSWRLALTWLG